MYDSCLVSLSIKEMVSACLSLCERGGGREGEGEGEKERERESLEG